MLGKSLRFLWKPIIMVIIFCSGVCVYEQVYIPFIKIQRAYRILNEIRIQEKQSWDTHRNYLSWQQLGIDAKNYMVTLAANDTGYSAKISWENSQIPTLNPMQVKIEVRELTFSSVNTNVAYNSYFIRQFIGEALEKEKMNHY